MQSPLPQHSKTRKAQVLPSASLRPVIIPSKGTRLLREKNRPQTQAHNGMRPAVAALLAVTAIPPPSKKQRAVRRRRSSASIVIEPVTPTFGPSDLPLSFDEFIDEAFEQLELPRPSACCSPLSLLLSPPDLFDDQESTLSVRSSSTESVPSLDTDNESSISWESKRSHLFYHARRRCASDNRVRILSSSPEECPFDHPLMLDSDEEVPTPEPENDFSFFSEDAIKRVTRRLNFKSNLTASLRVLKSAARSFTSISVSAPLVQPDDYLTRSILSITPQYTDEKRPAPSLSMPTPALRRYLNPTNSTHDSPCTGAIQMQTYRRSSRSKSSNRHSPIKTANNNGEDGGDPFSAASGPVTRQREVRENGDFLRIIVLEMNMRRGGKLSDTAQGKARLVLPPRQPCKYRAVGDAGRWEPLVCVYDE
ncbi:hypothetical protein RUND412_004046 [Rhizina undulata]